MKLYDDGHLKSFDAMVTFCGTDERGTYVLLDKTAFFPEGGGQSCDDGIIGDAECIGVYEVFGEIRHYVNRNLETGDTVSCKIDFKKRFRRMQNHTGEHIISALVYKKYGFKNVGFHLGETDVTCDFDGELSKSQIADIECSANNIVFENRQVNILYPSKDELSKLNYRSKIDIDGEIRIVEINGVDLCACCAPHVSMTGEIGLIKIVDFLKWKGGVRIHLKCGIDAFADYANKHEQIHSISTLLCVKKDEASEGVKKLFSEFHEKELEVSALKKEKTEALINSIRETDGNIVIFFDTDTDGLRAIVNAGIPKCTGFCIALSGSDGDFKFAVGSKNLSVKTLIWDMKNKFSLRGGGSDIFASGAIYASRNEIESFFG